MLLERNQVFIGLLAIVFLGLLTAVAVGLSGGAFVAGTEIRAEFTDAAGLEDGDFVFVAGVRTGIVTSVEIVEEHVEVVFKLDTEARIPADSDAAIFLSNTLGKRAIKVLPGRSDAGLADGDVIPLERTTTPVDFPELGDETVRLLGDTDVEALQELTTALADVTEGMRDDVVALLDGVERLTRVIADRRVEIAAVIDRAHIVINAAADKDQEIVALIDDFAVVLDTLVRRRGDVEKLLRETAATTDIAADLVEDRRAQIDRVLLQLHDDLQIVDDHQVDLAHLFAYAGTAVEGFASIGYSDGPEKNDNPMWGNVFTTGLGAIGIEATLGCGGTLDVFLEEIIGPDPACDGDATDTTTTASDAPRAGTGFTDFFGRALALRAGGR